MIKFYFIFSLFVGSLFANSSFDISTVKDKKSSLEYLQCIKESATKFDFEDILHATTLKKIDKSNKGYSFDNFWCKLELHNSSQATQNVVLYNPRPGMDFIESKIYKNNTVYKTIVIGDMRSLENSDFKSIFSNFTLTLEPNETITLITKYHSTGNIELDWVVSTSKDFLSYNNLNFTLIFFYLGFMLSIMFYKLFSYYYVRDKIYLVYALFVFSAVISNISVTGVMHYYFSGILDYFTITITSFIFSHIFLASLWAFTILFFNIDKKSKFYYPMIFIVFYNVVVTLLYSYAYIDVNIIKITPFVLFFALIESILLLLFSFIMLFKKKAGSKLFFMGHFFYVGSIIYYILNLSGKQMNPMESIFLSSFGIILATYFMSLALSSRFKILKDENDAIKFEIVKNKEYTIIGTTIAYVAHQWKQPLSILASQSMKIKAMIDNNPTVTLSKISNDINKIDKSILFISDTLNSIQSLFKVDTTNKEEFYLRNVLNVIKKDSFCSNIIFNIDIKNNYQLYGNQNLFIHAIINIVQNSIDALKVKNIQNGQITISNNSSDNIVLSITDNAGGIDTKNINKIFDKTKSSKSSGMGIGLSITKDILEKEFNFNISVESTKKGTRLIIKNEF